MPVLLSIGPSETPPRRCSQRSSPLIFHPRLNRSRADDTTGQEQPMSNPRLRDKVAVITGGGSGIGRAAARRLVAEGARVGVAGINEAQGISSAREAGDAAHFIRTDVTDDDSVQGMVKAAKAKFGRIDVLLNCAGGSVSDDKPVTSVGLDIWDHTISLDLKGPFLCCRHVIPEMVAQGRG